MGFLRQCIPQEYIKYLEKCYNLKSALKSLSKWASDSKIHTEKLEQKLKGLKKSDSFTGDKYVLKQQLILFQKCLEVDSCFFLSIAQIGIHVSKYSVGSNLYWSIMKKLNKIADKNQDFRGKKNYIGPFIGILKSNLKYIDKRISCDMVNNMSQSYIPYKNPSLYNQTMYRPLTMCRPPAMLPVLIEIRTPGKFQNV